MPVYHLATEGYCRKQPSKIWPTLYDNDRPIIIC